jgi:hypothetical protein
MNHRKTSENYKVNDLGCWIYYTKNGTGDSYGPYKAYYEMYKGPVPKGLEIMHTCDNKNCVNPEHLMLGTHADNLKDASGRMQTLKILSNQTKKKHFAGAAKLYKKRQEIIELTGWR